MLDSNRGTYEIVSAFFFVIVLVTSAIGLVFLSQIVGINEIGAIENAQRFSQATLSKERLLNCYGTTHIEFSRVNEPCESGPYLEGFTLEVLETPGCTSVNYTRGNEIGTDALVYFVPVSVQSKQCLGKLTVFV